MHHRVTKAATAQLGTGLKPRDKSLTQICVAHLGLVTQLREDCGPGRAAKVRIRPDMGVVKICGVRRRGVQQGSKGRCAVAPRQQRRTAAGRPNFQAALKYRHQPIVDPAQSAGKPIHQAGACGIDDRSRQLKALNLSEPSRRGPGWSVLLRNGPVG